MNNAKKIFIEKAAIGLVSILLSKYDLKDTEEFFSDGYEENRSSYKVIMDSLGISDEKLLTQDQQIQLMAVFELAVGNIMKMNSMDDLKKLTIDSLNDYKEYVNNLKSENCSISFYSNEIMNTSDEEVFNMYINDLDKELMSKNLKKSKKDKSCLFLVTADILVEKFGISRYTYLETSVLADVYLRDLDLI